MSGLTSRWSLLNWFRSNNDNHDATDEQAHNTATTATAEAQDTNAHTTTDVATSPPSQDRDRAIEQLQGAYEEVVGLMSNIQNHMQAQSDRSERLINMLDGLPEALKSLPEAQRNQSQMLQAIQGHLAQQTEHTQGLTHAIQGLAQTADNHERSMSIIQQQLDTNQQSNQSLLTSFDSLGQTLDRMSENNQAGTQVLERLAQRNDQTDAHMRDLFSRNQRQMTMMSIVSWALAIIALGVAGAVAFWVVQQTAGPGEATAANAAPTAITQPAETQTTPSSPAAADASDTAAASTATAPSVTEADAGSSEAAAEVAATDIATAAASVSEAAEGEVVNPIPEMINLDTFFGSHTGLEATLPTLDASSAEAETD